MSILIHFLKSTTSSNDTNNQTNLIKTEQQETKAWGRAAACNLLLLTTCRCDSVWRKAHKTLERRREAPRERSDLPLVEFIKAPCPPNWDSQEGTNRCILARPVGTVTAPATNIKDPSFCLNTWVFSRSKQRPRVLVVFRAFGPTPEPDSWGLGGLNLL